MNSLMLIVLLISMQTLKGMKKPRLRGVLKTLAHLYLSDMDFQQTLPEQKQDMSIHLWQE